MSMDSFDDRLKEGEIVDDEAIEGETPKKKIKFTEKKRCKRSAKDGETLEYHKLVSNTPSVVTSITDEDDWNADVLCDISLAVENLERKRNPNSKSLMVTTKIGNMQHIKELLKQRKKDISVQNEIDYEKVKEEYLSLTTKTKPSTEMNLDDYHKWMNKDSSPIKHSKTLEVLRKTYSSKWDPSEINRQGTIKLVSHPKVVLELILNEMDYKTRILDLVSINPNQYKLSLTIMSKPQWTFNGKGNSREMALEDASQSAIQFLLLMSV